MAATYPQVLRKINSDPPVEKEFVNLVQTVGDCLEDALKFIVWKEHMTYTEVFTRVWRKYKYWMVSLRKTSPCFCVLKEHEHVCLFCPLKESQKGRIEFIKKHVREYFMSIMTTWDEFERLYIEN